MSFPSGLVVETPALVGGISGGVRTRASATFAAANGTAITTLTPPWTKHTAHSTNTLAPIIDNNLLHSEDLGTIACYYRPDFAPISANYDVSCTIVAKTDNNAAQGGAAGRLVAGAATFYLAHYVMAGDTWQLLKRVAGAGTLLGSYVALAVTDQPYLVTLRMVGSTIQMLVDGVLRASATDTEIPAAGLAGFRLQGNQTSLVGVHLRDWSVRQ